MREGAQQIQRRGRLAIGLDLPPRIGRARVRGELGAVDDVAAIARQLDAVLLLGRRGARLGELAGDAADLHHRRGRRDRSAPPPSAGTRGRSRGSLLAPCSARSSRRSRRPAAGKPRRRRRARAPSSGCAPRLQKPAAERSQAASPRRQASRRPDSRGTWTIGFLRQLSGVQRSGMTHNSCNCRGLYTESRAVIPKPRLVYPGSIPMLCGFG